MAVDVAVDRARTSSYKAVAVSCRARPGTAMQGRKVRSPLTAAPARSPREFSSPLAFAFLDSSFPRTNSQHNLLEHYRHLDPVYTTLHTHTSNPPRLLQPALRVSFFSCLLCRVFPCCIAAIYYLLRDWIWHCSVVAARFPHLPEYSVQHALHHPGTIIQPAPHLSIAV